MTFLPIVERELRVAARKAGTHRFRFYGALLVVLIWLVLVLVGRSSVPLTELGHTLFNALAFLALLFCLLAGVFLTADCLSEEKREGTIGLLFLTDLRGYDVVLGKLAATSLHSVYGLLAIFPILALPLLLGGITGGEFARVMLALLGTLFFSLTSGLLISVISREARQAMTATLGVILLASVVIPIAYAIVTFFFKTTLISLVQWLSPIIAYSRAFDSRYHTRAGPHEFWSGVGVLFGLSLGLLGLAMRILPRAWQEKAQTPATNGRPVKSGRFRFGDACARESLRSKFLSPNPFFWLASRDRLPRILVWSLFGVIMPAWLCCMAATFSISVMIKGPAFSFSVLATFGLHLILKCLVVIEASRRLSDDRQSGALEVMLVTPLSEKQILAGQRRALLRHFRWPMIFTIIANLCVWRVVEHELRNNSEDSAIFAMICFGGIFMLLIDFYTLGWVSMWTALSARRYHRAVLGALGRVMLLPWLTILLAGFMTAGMGGISSKAVGVFICCWYTLGTVNDLIAAIWAKNKLQKQFRRFANGPAVRQPLTGTQAPALLPLKT